MHAPKHNVFVYGTLKRGYSNWKRLLDGKATFVSEAVTIDRFVMLDNGFPILLPADEDGQQVFGEVFEVGDAVMRSLDFLEGEGSMYDRKLVKVQLADGRKMTVHIYIGCEYWAKSEHAEEWTATNAAGQLVWS